MKSKASLLIALAMLATSAHVLAANLLAPGQPIVGVAATVGSASSAIAVVGGAGNTFPAAESPPNSIDGTTTTKYLNFARINCGFIVTVPGGLTYVNGFQFTTANDASDRDPVTINIEGTSASDPTTAAGGATWTQLYSGVSGLAADPGRFALGTPISFANSSGFNTYRLLITDTRLGTANSMQFSEIQFFGTSAPDTNAPVILSVSPVPGSVGSLTSVTVTFSEAVAGVDAADLRINGTPATNVSGNSAVYTFVFPQPPLGSVQISFAGGHGISDFASPPNVFDETATNASWQYLLTDLTPPTVTSVLPIPGILVRSLNQIEVLFSEPVTNVEAGDLLINGAPAATIDGVAPGQYVFSFLQPATGTVQVAWAPGHGIKDLYSNNFAGGSWTYLLDPNAGLPVVLINEFMADNNNTLNDEDGDASDWIELRNMSPYAVNLFGWYLTDNALNLRKWKLPEVTIGTNGYLVIFASNKNRTNATGRLHTNFQLNNNGEYLGLVAPDGSNVVSEFAPAYPAQRQDVSYGRDPLLTDLVGFFSTPTPGAGNIPGGAGFAPEVVFSQESGTFVNPFSLSLSLDQAATNVVIRYLLFTSAAGLNNTNVPTTNSPVYTNPIPISATTHVRARAFQAGSLPSSPQSQSYIMLNTNSLSFTSDLPIVVLHNMGAGTVPSSADQFVMMQEFDPKNGAASLTNAPDLTARGIFHLRGSSTLGYAKGSFFFEAEDEFGGDKNIPFAGLPADSDWALYAPNNFEPVLIHNPTAYEISRQLGSYASRTRFVVVVLNTAGGAITLPPSVTTGNYNGIYVLEEKIKIDKNRVDIDKLENENTAPPAVTGGYLLSIDRTAPGESQLTAGGQTMNYVGPNWTDISIPQRLPQRLYISNYFAAFGAAVSSATYTNPVSGYMPYINADSWIDHSIIDIITFNVDGLRLSGYFYKPRNGGITQGPVWDFDRTQNSTDGRDANPRVFRSQTGDLGTDFFNPQSNGVAWWGRMFTDPNFFQKWVDRYQLFRAEGRLANTNIAAIIDTFVSQVRLEQPREQARWSVTPRYGGYTGEVAQMKIWYSNRLDFIDTNFLARPRLSTNGGPIQPGFQLVLTPPAEAGSSMYYTLDGTDPRALHGGIAASAQLYTTPITLSNNTRVTTRLYNVNHHNLTGPNNPPISVPWSGPNAATFVVHTPDLIVTELMYHPGPGPVADTNDVDNYEFIELKNVGTNTLNLLGFKFTNGIDFTFTTNSSVTSLAPGGYVVVVKNTNSFAARYGVNPTVAGQYDGNFDNSGERVTLVGPALEVVIDFVYNDAWFNLTDGIGFSLVALDDTGISNLSTNTSWRRSNVDGGSPGAVNPPVSVITDVVIVNEALTHTDLPFVDVIELFNPGTNAVDIGGWWLTDDFNTPKKYQIPGGTIVAAHSFVTFDESQFNPGGLGFALGSDGDQVYVFSGGGGFLTGYYHGFDFGPAQNGRTFGRYVNSQGAEHFVAQATNTLGTNNSLPFIGPVVITEIMYHPPETGSSGNLVDNSVDEFIELFNITSTNVPLYHTLYASNTWRLSKAVDFSFPPGVIIPPSNFVLVVNFDPVTGGAAFRAKYGVPAGVPLFGPYGGKLDNSSESIRLSRPDAPNGVDVPFILVDRVDYADLAPWSSQADGFGASLHRLVPGAYGNDPTNWAAARATAGSRMEGGAPPIILQQPVGFTVVEGSVTNLSVGVSSSTAVSYQWRLNSNAVPGAVGAVLNFPFIQLNQAGTYDVSIFNGGGGLFSTTAVVNVLPLPAISLQPASTNIPPGSNFNFQVIATGTGPLSYQWRFNGLNINGATNPAISFTNAQLFPHTGLYDVLITDNIGTRFSQIATGIVLVRPGISNQPVARTVVQGQNATFSMFAGPNHPLLPLSYRWLTNGVQQALTTVPTYTFTNCQAGRSVRVNVVNLAGNINSSTVALTVLADADGDGIPDSYESSYPTILSPGNPADAFLDPDGDTMNNLQEYIAGTVPTNGASYLKLEPLQFLPGNNAVLQFAAVSNRTYTIDFRDTLDGPTWTNLYSIPAATTNRTLLFTNPFATPMRVYRIQIPPQQ